ncbi:hypothetical protein ACP70R_023285 [Stipagrostis hirtigluma subsp. patula]
MPSRSPSRPPRSERRLNLRRAAAREPPHPSSAPRPWNHRRRPATRLGKLHLHLRAADHGVTTSNPLAPVLNSSSCLPWLFWS